ncbi:ASCH domain-containing protein [Cupriavidus taiwanensis]|uniref:ASCH domain-containing protein n=1 Tax=Cupriavidus taiwanensis TaxID=164546 RepID=UPI0015749873|nr:ASCH domain-containing protein [Cupriavidus taiwanensis]NSX18129.1 ASCH domain-containing protein [Cupriavidus taiwanensis]
MRTLTIPVKGIYFDQIKAGTKHEEFRLVTPYWAKRLRGRAYDQIILTRGYPKADDQARRLVLPWRGYRVTVIEHEHFGAKPVKVFAIDVRSTGAHSPANANDKGE